ncbi:prolyl oligopeptidase family serine peptidase [Candidatus Woesebacteria bacterium]|nr:prolyl oligopeptidase family serine peptidase [Candidatus Woesebacteria bacterium]
MKYFIGFLIGLLLLSVGFWLGLSSKEGLFDDKITNVFTNVIKEESLDLDQYSIENLTSTEIKSGKIEILEKTQDKEKFSTYLFRFNFNPDPIETYEKSSTGVINIPKDNNKPDIILMIRGYVDQNYFVSGMGTRRSSEYFAQNGYITIAPDYLGYGGSSEESKNIFETRFQTYTTTLSLLKSLEKIKSNSRIISCHSELDSESCDNIKELSSAKDVFLWAHSNGGQIALTALAITGKVYPTVLWAPVTKPFPYSVLYYTDQSDDGGKLIRKELSRLEEYNDVSKFSFTDYLDRISAPIQIYQGTNDDAVPVEWSQTFFSNLKNSYEEREIEQSLDLIIKNRADHNLVPGWEETVEQSLKFFQKY